MRLNAENDQTYVTNLYSQKTENFADRLRKQAQKNENDLKVISV